MTDYHNRQTDQTKTTVMGKLTAKQRIALEWFKAHPCTMLFSYATAETPSPDMIFNLVRGGLVRRVYREKSQGMAHYITKSGRAALEGET